MLSNANYDGVWYKDGKEVGIPTYSTHVGHEQVVSLLVQKNHCGPKGIILFAQIKSTDDLMTIKDGALHKLVIKNCTEDDNGKYRFEADGRKTEALLTVEGNLIYELVQSVLDQIICINQASWWSSSSIPHSHCHNPAQPLKS